PAAIHFLHHPLDVFVPGHVGLDCDLAELAGDLLDLGAVEVGEHEPGAVGGESPSGGGADAAGRAGDEHGTSTQVGHLVSLCPGRENDAQRRAAAEAISSLLSVKVTGRRPTNPRPVISSPLTVSSPIRIERSSLKVSTSSAKLPSMGSEGCPFD